MYRLQAVRSTALGSVVVKACAPLNYLVFEGSAIQKCTPLHEPKGSEVAASCMKLAIQEDMHVVNQ